MITSRSISALAALALFGASLSLWADDGDNENAPLIDFSDSNQTGLIKESNATASVETVDGAQVVKGTFNGGEQYPTLTFPAPHGVWDLSAYAGVEVTVTNTSKFQVTMALRVDNDPQGDWSKQAWNSESLAVEPGETKTIHVAFGLSYGGQPGYELDPTIVNKIIVFAVFPVEDAVVNIDSIKPWGKKGDLWPGNG